MLLSLNVISIRKCISFVVHLKRRKIKGKDRDFKRGKKIESLNSGKNIELFFWTKIALKLFRENHHFH